MSLTPDWAPNLHPLLVHFPIALLTTAVVVDLLSLLRRRSSALRDAATWLYLAGTAGALLAYFSGRDAVAAMSLSEAIEPLVVEHENWAFRATWFFAFFASLRLAMSYIFPPKPLIAVFAFGAALVGMVMLFETAERGGTLVYQHGVGVREVTGSSP